MRCPLCNSLDLSLLHQYTNKYNNQLYNRIYHLCSECKLICLEQGLRLNLKEEKHRYSQHNNNLEDEGYLRFLDKLLIPLTPLLLKTDKGLDYGCGPSVVLAKYLSKKGFEMQYYDPLFFSKPEPLNTQYEFITCTEVVEHFYKPAVDFYKINSLLKINGYLGLMTKLYETAQSFSPWYYHKDITHVSFYHKDSINWIAKHFRWKVILLSNQVVIFQKQSGSV